MSILVDTDTRLIVQGITGRDGAFHAGQMLAYGTEVVGGVTPGKGGRRTDDGIPIFDAMEEAVAETGGNASVIYVPAVFAADAICEAADAGVRLVVCITEGIPVKDLVKVLPYIRESLRERPRSASCPERSTCRAGWASFPAAAPSPTK